MATNEQFLEDLKNAPRITSLAKHFEDIATGRTMVPVNPVEADLSLLQDKTAVLLYNQLKNRLGKFNEHAYASIPYALENCIRIMLAIYFYSTDYKKLPQIKNFNLYEMGAGTGDMTRLLPEITQGYIASLCSSATHANLIEFNKYKTHKNSYFYVGPYYDVTRNFLVNHKELSCFSSGFDIIFERCTFQMYGADRENQIMHVAKILKEDGILILDEKILNDDIVEYNKREKIKDEIFKSKYFNVDQVNEKKETILNTMTQGLVNLTNLSLAIKKSFKYAVAVWNSTNFYTIIASNSDRNIQQFVASMIPPCIPEEFNFEKFLPKKLFGLEECSLVFREFIR